MRAHGELAPTLALMSSGDLSPFIAEGFAGPAGVDVLWAGSAESDDVRAVEAEAVGDGRFRALVSCSDGWSRHVTPSVPGRKAVDDMLLALALVWRLGLDRDVAMDAVERMAATHMRLEVVEAPCGARLIDDSYNAAPASMASSLDVLCDLPGATRRVAVLGEMGELGDEAARLHGYVGAGEMAEAARTMGLSEDAIECFPSVERATEVMAPVLGDGDVVLVKASRAAGLDAFVRGVLAR